MPEAPVTKEEIENAPLKAKIRAAEEIIKRTLEEYGAEKTAVSFDASKDTVLTAWITGRVCEDEGIEKPAMTYSGSQENREAAEDIAEKLGFELKDLDISEDGLEAVISSSRWDKTGGSEGFYTPHTDPEHLRVEPVLQFEEREVWDATWFHMAPEVKDVQINRYPETEEDLPQELERQSLPVLEKYWQGYRTLDSEESQPEPAWSQDLENTSEGSGESQGEDSEEIRNKLRDLGYL